MSLFFTSVFSCAWEPHATPPEQIEISDLGQVYPPMAGRYNAFSSLFGAIHQDDGCFVLWNFADRSGRIVRVSVPCPPEQPEWSNCDGLLLQSGDASCICQPLASADFAVPCPEIK